jgi:hypothetical protein
MSKTEEFLLLVKIKKILIKFLAVTLKASRKTYCLKAIKVDTHITAKYTRLRWQEHNAIGRALPRNADL